MYNFFVSQFGFDKIRLEGDTAFIMQLSAARSDGSDKN